MTLDDLIEGPVGTVALCLIGAGLAFFYVGGV